MSTESTSIGLQSAASGVARGGDPIETEGTVGVEEGEGEAIWTEGAGAVPEESASDESLSSSVVGSSMIPEVDGPARRGEGGSVVVDFLGMIGWGRWARVDGVAEASLVFFVLGGCTRFRDTRLPNTTRASPI